MKTTQKEPFKCSWWPKTIILGFEVRSWKKSWPKNQNEIKDRTDRFRPYFCPDVANFTLSITLIW